MNILILISSFPPDINSAADLYYELAEDLKKNNHKIVIITGFADKIYGANISQKHKWSVFLKENINGIDVLRISKLLWLSKVPMGKVLRYLLICFLFVIRGINLKKPDVVLVYSPPLNIGFAGYLIAKIKKVPFIFNMQDIHPKVLIDLKALRNTFVINLLLDMERLIYKNAKNIIVYSKGNLEYLVKRGIGKNKISIIPNWVDTELVAPSDKMNDIRKIYMLRNKFVVTYAGTIGKAQNLEAIIESAEMLKEKKDIIFLIVGAGDTKSSLQQKVVENNVSNVVFLPLQPKDQYVSILNASDVCLLPLSKDIPIQTVPGKLPQLMACGRPIIACVSSNGDAKKIIEKAECGYCVEPGDSNGLALSILKLYSDRSLGEKMGENGRVEAEKEYSRSICTKKYEEILKLSMTSLINQVKNI